MKEITKTINYLSKNGILHLDIHGGNILTDGKHIYLTDFGLALDKKFNLNEDEKLFFKMNRYYDYGLAYKNIDSIIFNAVKSNEELRRIFNLEENLTDNNYLVVYENLSEICDYLNINSSYKKSLIVLKDILALYGKFIRELITNNRKDNVFPNTELKNMLTKVSMTTY